MGRDKFYPDADEPHIHEHKGGVTYTNTRHKHKDLQAGDNVREANCRAVVEDLEHGNAREKKIARWITDNLL